MKKGLHKFKKVCYDNPRWETGMIFGPVAQLGERTVRIRKVVGSNPFRSTIKSREIERFRGFLQLIETLTRANFCSNLPSIGSHP